MFWLWFSVCEELSSGVWMVVDLTWSGWESVAEIAGIRYLRADLGITPFMRATELTLIKLRNSTDAALIFQHKHRKIKVLHFEDFPKKFPNYIHYYFRFWTEPMVSRKRIFTTSYCALRIGWQISRISLRYETITFIICNFCWS